MRYLFALMTLVFTGCAGASPVDFLIPTKQPSPATQEYLGHLYSTNKVNMVYHSLSDTKYQKMLVPLRDNELRGLKAVAQGELEFIDAVGTKASNTMWGLVLAGATALGWQLPSPREKAKITEALHKPPPVAT